LVDLAFRFLPIIPSLTTIPVFDNHPEEKQTRLETPLCRIFGCKKEDVFLGLSVSELLDDMDIPYASEDYETSCLRCYKVYGFKYIAVHR
jgi:hypothetical protein